MSWYWILFYVGIYALSCWVMYYTYILEKRRKPSELERRVFEEELRWRVAKELRQIEQYER